MTHKAYKKLEVLSRRISLLGEAAGMLHWDAATMMPSGGGESRSLQLAELDAISHSLITAPETADLIGEARDNSAGLNDWQQSNLTEMHRRWLRATALSEDLVVARSKAGSACEAIWRDARTNDDFAAVLPSMTTVLELTREAGNALSDKLGTSVYDALLDDFEPGLSSSQIDVIFGALEEFLPDFLGEVMEHQASLPAPVMPEGPFSIEKQRQLGHKMMETLGFDFDHGRLDVSLHPFCGGTSEDVRLTTRYDENDFTSALMGVLHETGHAMYEQGLPKEWRLQPVGGALGMSIHESQSLLIEMQVCRSREFLEYAAPVIRDCLGGSQGGSGPAWETDNLYRIYTQVKPGFIRVDADEVTYPAHIILRYRLERALLQGDMNLADLPGAWNEGMKSLLGITPPTDREGCLQDIHWYDGAWSYFPTYTLGAMSAAQLFSTATQSNPAIVKGISAGNFTPLLGWLRQNVHSQGSLNPADTLLKNVTGSTLDPEIFKAHLRSRYLS